MRGSALGGIVTLALIAYFIYDPAGASAFFVQKVQLLLYYLGLYLPVLLSSFMDFAEQLFSVLKTASSSGTRASGNFAGPTHALLLVLLPGGGIGS